MRLTSHFSVEELCGSATAKDKGIDNTPDDNVLSNLLLLADGLERVRSVLGVPLYINSGYRSPKLNAAVKGSKNSDHMRGLAADFVAPEFGTPLEIAYKLADNVSTIQFKQLIMEGAWVHISFPDPDNLRSVSGEVLTAHFSPGGVTYTRGLA